LPPASRHPVLFYHIPEFAPEVPPDLVAGLPVWGVKDSGGDELLAAGRPLGWVSIMKRLAEERHGIPLGGVRAPLPGAACAGWTPSVASCSHWPATAR
jgi:hypothetical protein